MEKISIIVPIYNCEKYLDDCLSSIRNQSYSNLEIILLNDGSSDASEKICLEHKKNDKRIKYLYKENSGAANTRNLGIEKATGEYIMFVDADDYIDLDYIELLYKSLKSNNVDVVVSGFTTVDEKGILIKKHFFDVKKDVLEFDEYIDTFINSPYFTCVKMLMKKNSIEKKFVTNLKYGEDMLFAYNILKNNKLHYEKNCGYYYVQNVNSVTHNSTINSIEKYMDDTKYLFDIIKADSPQVDNILKSRLFSKFNLGTMKLVYNKNIKYNELKEFILSAIDKFEFSNADLSIINYGNKLNKFKIYLLKKKNIFCYYIIALLTNKEKVKKIYCKIKKYMFCLKKKDVVKNEK